MTLNDGSKKIGEIQRKFAILNRDFMLEDLPHTIPI